MRQAIGAGERAAFVAEELGFEQRGRQRRAVHADHRTSRAGTPRMNRAGDQLLADAGFAFNEHRGVERRHLFDSVEDICQRRARANDVFEASGGRRLLELHDLLVESSLQCLELSRCRRGARNGGISIELGLPQLRVDLLEPRRQRCRIGSAPGADG